MTSSTCLRHDPRQAWIKQTDYRSPLKAIAKICQTHNLKQIIGYLCYHGNKSSPRPNSVTTTPAIKKRKKARDSTIRLILQRCCLLHPCSTCLSLGSATTRLIHLFASKPKKLKQQMGWNECVRVCVRACSSSVTADGVSAVYFSKKQFHFLSLRYGFVCFSFHFCKWHRKKVQPFWRHSPIIHTLQHRQLVPEQFQDQFENATVYKSHLAGTETEWRECIRNPALLRLCSNPVKDSMHTLFLGSALKLKVASLEYE